MAGEERTASRRSFLAGLLAGVGALVAVGGGAKGAGASPGAGPKGTPEPILYRRTEEALRYYRTLYYEPSGRGGE